MFSYLLSPLLNLTGLGVFLGCRHVPPPHATRKSHGRRGIARGDRKIVTCGALGRTGRTAFGAMLDDHLLARDILLSGRWPALEVARQRIALPGFWPRVTAP